MTPEQQRSMLGSVGTETVHELLQIAHPTIATLYFVRGTQNVTHGGHTWLPFQFALKPPAKASDGETIKATITVSIVDQRVEAALLALRGQDDVTMTMAGVYASDDTYLYGPLTMDYEGLTMQSMASAQISCTVFRKTLASQYPARNVTPSCAGAA